MQLRSLGLGGSLFFFDTTAQRRNGPLWILYSLYTTKQPDVAKLNTVGNQLPNCVSSACLYIHICMQNYICYTFVDLCIYSLFLNTCSMRICNSIYVHSIYVCMHACTHAGMYACMFVCMHTYLHSAVLPSFLPSFLPVFFCSSCLPSSFLPSLLPSLFLSFLPSLLLHCSAFFLLSFLPSLPCSFRLV